MRGVGYRDAARQADGHVAPQAQKAERYRKYKAEVKDIELWKASHRWLAAAGEGTT